ncbi:MAG: phosphonoacetate hydrolase [SAR324 cluster bacterium]|nr:phosphonoacetate hydrolase [SAR324 cluster bacterium]
MNAITVNGRSYKTPVRPVVVACIDGCDPEYYDEAIARGLLPNVARFRAEGFYAEADCVIPSFTNPNNLSIVTGAPPAVHGICGNFFLDPDTGEEVMMNDPRFLRSGSILAAFSQRGAKVVVITAKDKLRRLLGHGLKGGVCFSAEKAHEATLAENGIEGVPELVGRQTPDVYSAALSEFVFEAGVHLLKTDPPQLMYLSTTDYVQHKHAPGDPASDRFYRALDAYFGALEELGAIVALTADHGMNPKNTAEGRPNVIFLAPLLDEWLGAGKARVILPITDPYVAHHGALGSFATAYLPRDADAAALAGRLRALEGMELVLTRGEGCARFELPEDRMGDLILLGNQRKVLGTSAANHDLSQLDEPLRSHGGLAEQRVPLLLNRPCPDLPEDRALRNFDVFDLAMNYAR